MLTDDVCNEAKLMAEQNFERKSCLSEKTRLNRRQTAAEGLTRRMTVGTVCCSFVLGTSCCCWEGCFLSGNLPALV